MNRLILIIITATIIPTYLGATQINNKSIKTKIRVQVAPRYDKYAYNIGPTIDNRTDQTISWESSTNYNEGTGSPGAPTYAYINAHKIAVGTKSLLKDNIGGGRIFWAGVGKDLREYARYFTGTALLKIPGAPTFKFILREGSPFLTAQTVSFEPNFFNWQITLNENLPKEGDTKDGMIMSAKYIKTNNDNSKTVYKIEMISGPQQMPNGAGRSGVITIYQTNLAKKI